MPREKAWLVYDKWFKIYGEMVYFKVFGQGYLFLGSSAKIKDLFEKRSTNYSDRVQTPMLLDLSQSAFAATAMDISYGIKVTDENDPYIALVEEAFRGISQAGVPGQFLVDLLPILKNIPSWMPGASFKRKADYWRRINVTMLDMPFDHHRGAAPPSLAASSIEALQTEQGKDQAKEETLAKNVAGIAYIAGADTTISAVRSFFLAMVMYPEVQRKGQAEIDSVVGSNRLPDFGDRQSLPYINEFTVLPHTVWVRSPASHVHICPGRHFSDNSLYAMIALTLSVYTISPPVDDQGNTICLKPEPTSGLLSYPALFECIIKPRSRAAEALISEEAND
ncbi:cytochrome P450 [Collybia nuda]|uniref:Cytochrome P450 n=1 Tax=Collybia nuda TaxID=64659 RepID=A0A9P5XTI6_9AGAR|nr:cytochrome P450 [Collybia nuda]